MGPPTLRRLGDRVSNEFLASELARRHPTDPVLSEEAADGPIRLASRRVWIVDPLDGTREFAETGRRDWAVHVALCVDGEAVAGAVALPALGITTGTVPKLRRKARIPGPLRVVVSRSRPPLFAERFAERLGGRLVGMGSAGVKAISVVYGVADVFVHAGGQFEWDTAAPAAVATAAGLHVSRIDGSPLRFNKEVPSSPDLLICRRDVAASALEVLGELIEAPAVPGR